LDKKKIQRILVFWLKVGLSGTALYFVARKLDAKQLFSILMQLRYTYIVPAILFFCLSKLFSVFKTDLLMRNAGIHMTLWENLKLYWAGMFYNQFLPGGIGGDTYKVFLLKNEKQVAWRTGIGIMLNDRISGIIVLCTLVSALYYCIAFSRILNYFIWIAFLMFPLIYYLFLNRFYPVHRKSFHTLLFYSIFVQAFQFIMLAFVLAAVDQHDHLVTYVFIFGISSVGANLPISIGGIGIREFIFAAGAQFFGLIPEQAVLLSISFYFISFLVSLPGIIWVFRSPFPLPEVSLASGISSSFEGTVQTNERYHYIK
jgi:uncharacterized membrane protein YbhN (UPF0104 family)